MQRRKGPNWAQVVLAVSALAIVVALGLQLRLDEVLRSEALPAEDPYNHLAFTREHLADGNLGPLYEGGDLYPPGMHAVLATYHAYTGVDLHEVFRLAPALFGALGVVGMAILVWRFAGAPAGLLAGLAYAVGPEVVFRTTMMAPTALDLAVLPYFLYALLRLVEGRLAWATPTAATALFLVFAHPWLLSLLLLAGGVFLVVAFLFPWSSRTENAATPSPTGLGAAVAILGVAWAISLSGCWGSCGEGLGVVAPEGHWLASAWAAFAAAAVVLAALLVVLRRLLSRFLSRREARSWPLAGQVVVAVVLGMATLATTVVAFDAGLPPNVGLVSMFGWPILILGILGLVLVPFRPGPLAVMGASIALTTYPMVVFNPFDSPFWSHRTAAYLAVGITILVGVAARVLVLAGSAVSAHLAKPRPQRGAAPRGFNARPMIAALLVLLVVVPMGGAVYAATPPINAGGWYRLFTPCGMDGLEEVAREADIDPTTIVIAASWRSKLVISAHATHADRIWFDEEFFESEERRLNITTWADHEDRTVIVVVDKYFRWTNPDANVSYLERDPWSRSGAWCIDEEPDTKPIVAYSNRDVAFG